MGDLEAWWFVGQDLRPRHGHLAPASAGVVHRFEGTLTLGHEGLHASVRATDAFVHGHGPIACRVVLRGEILRGDTQLCGAEREILWTVDATPALEALVTSLAPQKKSADDLRAALRALEETRQDLAWAVESGRSGDARLADVTAEIEGLRRDAHALDAKDAFARAHWAGVRSALLELDPDEDALTTALLALPRNTTAAPARQEDAAPQPWTLPWDFGHAREGVVEALKLIPWIRRAAIGTAWWSYPNVPVLYVDLARWRLPKLRNRAALIYDVVRSVAQVPTLLVVFDRAHAPRVNLVQWDSGIRVGRVMIEARELEEHEVLFEREVVRPVATDAEPMTITPAMLEDAASIAKFWPGADDAPRKKPYPLKGRMKGQRKRNLKLYPAPEPAPEPPPPPAFEWSDLFLAFLKEKLGDRTTAFVEMRVPCIGLRDVELPCLGFRARLAANLARAETDHCLVIDLDRNWIVDGVGPKVRFWPQDNRSYPHLGSELRSYLMRPAQEFGSHQLAFVPASSTVAAWRAEWFGESDLPCLLLWEWAQGSSPYELRVEVEFALEILRRDEGCNEFLVAYARPQDSHGAHFVYREEGVWEAKPLPQGWPIDPRLLYANPRLTKKRRPT
ncbi:MAG: hypothetical protein AAGE52_05935 [Myxococcota bacterium]